MNCFSCVLHPVAYLLAGSKLRFPTNNVPVVCMCLGGNEEQREQRPQEELWVSRIQCRSYYQTTNFSSIGDWSIWKHHYGNIHDCISSTVNYDLCSTVNNALYAILIHKWITVYVYDKGEKKKNFLQSGSLSVYLPKAFSFFLLILYPNVCLGSLAQKAIWIV